MAKGKGADVYVALMRGINVGGKNAVPMNELARIFEAARCTEVATYIQSGNVVFRAKGDCADRVPHAVAKILLDRRGLRVPVVLRTAEELHAVVNANPFVAAGADAGILHVVFLAQAPSAECVASLDQGRSPPDEFRVLGSEIYLSCPNGVGKSKLTNAYFDAKLATTSTMRNWRTVLKLAEMARLARA
jgi:uncharacterized protein (DUF1697 family)